MVRVLLFVAVGSFFVGCSDTKSTGVDVNERVDDDAEVKVRVDGAVQSGAADAGIDGHHAVGVLSPRRLIFLVHEFGFSEEATATVLPSIHDEGTWTANIAPSDLRKSSVFKELADLASDITIVTGLAVYPAIERRAEDPALQTALLTGLPTALISQRSRQARGPSLDYLIRENLGAVAGPLINGSKSLDLSYGMGGQKLDSAGSAQAIFDRLASTPSSNSCDLGQRPENAVESSQRLSGWMKGVADIMVRGMACDRARIFTLSTPRPSTDEYVLPFIPAGDLDQEYNDRVSLSDASGLKARAVMLEQQRLTAKQVNILVNQLRSNASSSGSLLDDTLVVWVSNEARPGHAPSPWTAVLLGGKNLGIKGGRMLHFAQDRSFTVAANQQVVKFGLPHNRLLVSLSQLMGLNQPAVGAASITLSDGKQYDLRGELPGLK